MQVNIQYMEHMGMGKLSWTISKPDFSGHGPWEDGNSRKKQNDIKDNKVGLFGGDFSSNRCCM